MPQLASFPWESQRAAVGTKGARSKLWQGLAPLPALCHVPFICRHQGLQLLLLGTLNGARITSTDLRGLILLAKSIIWTYPCREILIFSITGIWAPLVHTKPFIPCPQDLVRLLLLGGVGLSTQLVLPQSFCFFWPPGSCGPSWLLLPLFAGLSIMRLLWALARLLPQAPSTWGGAVALLAQGSLTRGGLLSSRDANCRIEGVGWHTRRGRSDSGRLACRGLLWPHSSSSAPLHVQPPSRPPTWASCSRPQGPTELSSPQLMKRPTEGLSPLERQEAEAVRQLRHLLTFTLAGSTSVVRPESFGQAGLGRVCSGLTASI